MGSAEEFGKGARVRLAEFAERDRERTLDLEGVSRDHTEPGQRNPGGLGEGGQPALLARSHGDHRTRHRLAEQFHERITRQRYPAT